MDFLFLQKSPKILRLLSPTRHFAMHLKLPAFIAETVEHDLKCKTPKFRLKGRL